MPIMLEDLLSQIPRTYERKLKELQKKERPRIAQALSAECRLTLNPSTNLDKDIQKVQIPIHLHPGCPYELREIAFPDDIVPFHKLSPYRNYLEDVGVCAEKLAHLVNNHYDTLEKINIGEHFDSPEWNFLVQESISTTSEFSEIILKYLVKHDPLQKISSVREDILGVYVNQQRNLPRPVPADIHNHKNTHHLPTPRPGSIILYWAVIGLFSRWMGCKFDDLSLVVLIHELAHAYTQIGCDIQGQNWDPEYYSNSDSDIKEGLAQYYTHRVLNRNKDRYSEAFKVFKKMMDWQDKKYKLHKKWIEDNSPEAVRYAMLAIRSQRRVTIQDFDNNLREAGRVLNRGE